MAKQKVLIVIAAFVITLLAAAAVLTKIIGVVYRIPLTNILGDEGNGFYGYAYQVYAIALMLSSFSLDSVI